MDLPSLIAAYGYPVVFAGALSQMVIALLGRARVVEEALFAAAAVATLVALMLYRRRRRRAEQALDEARP